MAGQLVIEDRAELGDAAGSVTVDHIAALNHEVLDDAVESGSLVPLALDTFAGKGDEVLHSLGRLLSEQAQLDLADRLVADGDFEDNLVRDNLRGGLDEVQKVWAELGG